VTDSYIDDRIWAVQIGEGLFNPDGAIYKYWRSLRDEADPPQYLGVPVTPEIETEVGVQQAFASGAVITWNPDTGASLTGAG
jgi:uncharacterized protein with LGFP repeats